MPLPFVSDDAKAIGDSLRRWRLALDLPASIAAERAGVSLPTLRAVERGGGDKVAFGTFLSLARVYGIEQPVRDGFEPLKTDLGVARAHLMQRKRVSR